MARYENRHIGNLMLSSDGNAPRTGKYAVSATGCSIATGVTAGDTVTIGRVTYTFRADPSAYESTLTAVVVDIGANAAGDVTNLVAAINATGTSGTTYSKMKHGLAIMPHSQVWAEETDGTVFKVSAKQIGSGGNAIATTETFDDGTDAWTAAVLSGGVDGTAGKPGQIVLHGGKAYECVANGVWRNELNHTMWDFKNNSPRLGVASNCDTQAAASGTAGDENQIAVGDGQLEYHIIGTQTLLYPTMAVGTGLLAGLDVVDTDGVEYTLGGKAGTNTVSSGRQYVVGKDHDFFIRAKIKMADVTGNADLCVGFRKLQAYEAGVDTYDEAAFFNIQLGVVEIHTILNNGATVETDTTETDWVDAATHEMMVRVSQHGVCTFYYDGDAPTVTKAFTFDTEEIVLPFIYSLHATTTPGLIHIVELECGYWNDNYTYRA